MKVTFFKGLLLITLFSLVAMSCKRTEYICPAYQSVFYLDKEASKKQFTTKLGPDSTPLDLNLKLKDEHLIAKYVPYKQKEKMIANIPMVTVFNKPSKEDSLGKMQFAAKDSVLKEQYRQGPALQVIEKDEDVEGADLPSMPVDTDTTDNFSDEEENKVPVVPTKELVAPSPATTSDSTKKAPKVVVTETDPATRPIEVVEKQKEPTVPTPPRPKVVTQQKGDPLKGGQRPAPKGKKK